MKYFGVDSVAECTDHRERLAEVTNVTTPRLLFHGHYHKQMTGVYIHKDEKNTVGQVFGLDEGAAKLPYHTFVFDFVWAKERIEQLDALKK
jgi:hypothetical protein